MNIENSSSNTTQFRIRRIGETKSQTSTTARNRLKQEFQRALINRSFVLYYQPQISLETHAVSGFEALVRWVQDDGSVILPMDFIPLAEEIGLMEPLGDCILDQCTRDYSRIQELMGSRDFRLAIKCTGTQFQKPEFTEHILAATEAVRMNPDRLEIEIGEDVLFRDPDWTVKSLASLRAIGVRISVKDFGASHFCLAFLRRFPLDTLRIRRTLIESLPHNEDTATIVRAILSMADPLGLRTAAEGVDTNAQLEFLQKYGCSAAQGCAISPALKLDELSSLLRDRAGSVLCLNTAEQSARAG